MTTTAAEAAILAAQAAADDAFFRSLDLSENNKENLPPWLLEEREPVWERQRAYLAAWRPSPEQERRYRARHPLPPQRDAAIHDIHFSMASTLPIIRPRRVRDIGWHEIFLREWERPIIPNPNPPPWISSARRGNPVPQPFLNSPILDSRGNLIQPFLPATENEPSERQEQMNTPRPEPPSPAAPERWSRNLQRRAPIPFSFSTPQISTPRISARNRPMSMMTLPQEDKVNEFEIFVDPEERENSAEEYELEDYEEEETLRSFSMSVDTPESDQEGEAVEQLAQRLSSIRIIVDGPADTGRNELTEAFASTPAMAPTVLAAIHRRPRSSTYPGNKDQYAFAPIDIITESAPSPVQMGLPKPGPITRSTPSLGQDPPATLVRDDESTGPVVSPLLRDFEEFKKSFPRRVREALELPVVGNRRVRSWMAHPSPPFENESGFLEAAQG
ncbi:uncharacterized protein H6S33_010799 [Morchella sextelata]|uniref:uncharacterized protein n=1 Tax=Morchella sextelata TaxID=1174677 RepID=UPI001D047436|nr:uncharacterized protein H6S33_010799 [Morchella sextelata]KAH0611534.1 hypothetical protein H6S33_010799 [Morchella sextelata]